MRFRLRGHDAISSLDMVGGTINGSNHDGIGVLTEDAVVPPLGTSEADNVHVGA